MGSRGFKMRVFLNSSSHTKFLTIYTGLNGRARARGKTAMKKTMYGMG